MDYKDIGTAIYLVLGVLAFGRLIQMGIFPTHINWTITACHIQVLDDLEEKTMFTFAGEICGKQQVFRLFETDTPNCELFRDHVYDKEDEKYRYLLGQHKSTSHLIACGEGNATFYVGHTMDSKKYLTYASSYNITEGEWIDILECVWSQEVELIKRQREYTRPLFRIDKIMDYKPEWKPPLPIEYRMKQMFGSTTNYQKLVSECNTTWTLNHIY